MGMRPSVTDGSTGTEIVKKKASSGTSTKSKVSEFASELGDCISDKEYYYVGIDPSMTSCGYAIVSPGGELIETGAIQSSTSDGDRISRAMGVFDTIGEILDRYPKVVACIEGYAYGIRDGQVFHLGELGGIVRMALNMRGVRWIEPAPTTLKKFISGKGNSKKEDIKAHILDQYGYRFMDKTNDEADAFLAAAYIYSFVTNKKMQKAK